MRMAIIKKNQIVIIVIALMLITAGYLNYTYSPEDVIKTSLKAEEENFGDATLVSSNNVATETAQLGISSEGDEEGKETKDASSVSTNANDNTRDYFVSARMERDNLFSTRLENFQKIIENSNSSNEQKQTATEEIKKINDTKNKIMIAENLIKLKDFSDVIILVNDSSVNVVVKAETLEKEQVAQIQNIVSRELQANLENIHITNK